MSDRLPWLMTRFGPGVVELGSGVAVSPLDPIDPRIDPRWGVPWHVMLDAHQPPPRPADRIISATPLPLACTPRGRRVGCP